MDKLITQCDCKKASRERVSVTVVNQLFKNHGFRARQAFKSEAGKKNIPYRDEQFKNINKLKKFYTDAGNPVLIMDVKKELIGNFFRSGTLHTQETIRVNDHDFPSYAAGKVIPHGLYNINKNKPRKISWVEVSSTNY